jgi:hypothetical protein
MVNTTVGGDIVQDLNWYCSQNPNWLKHRKETTKEAFAELMEKTHKVTYDAKGNWAKIG